MGFMGWTIRITVVAREVVQCVRTVAEVANDAIIAHHAFLIEEEALALGAIGRRIR